MRIVSPCLVAALILSSGCYLFHTEPGDDAQPDKRDAGITRAADGGTVSACSVHSYQVAEKFEPIDMVWVVDSSRSMTDEQARIKATINQFVDDVEARSFDVRLVMITATNIVPPPLGTDASRYLFLGRSVGDHEPLQALLDELPNYRSFLRPTAALHFVVVTDDESGLSADDFLTQMRASLGRAFVVHAVASPNVDGSPCRSDSPQCANVATTSRALCGAAAIGTQYYALAEQTAGLEISICEDDWSKIFGPLLDAVGSTAIPCTIQLSQAPSSDTQVTLRDAMGAELQLPRVRNSAACAQQRGYYIVTQGAQSQVALCPVACNSTTLTGVELRVAQDCTALR
jgi:hypothetical protein